MRLLSEAPIRISLFGGGTDTGEYAEKYGGMCINFAINIHQKFEINNEFSVKSYVVDSDPGFYKAFYEEYFEPNYMVQKFDGFINGGLGTSAAAAVALVAGLSRLNGKNLTREEIAEKAWNIEVNKLDLFGGKQDQYISSFGGFNVMRFSDGVNVTPVDRITSENIVKHILLFDTGIRRENKNIQEGLKSLKFSQKRALDEMKKITNYSLEFIGRPKTIGELLDMSWSYKKKSNKVSNNRIDGLYKKAKKLGAWGGKLCGSGGGGYMIFMLPQDKHNYFKEKIGLRWVDFGGIDWNGVRTRFLCEH